MPYDPDSPYDAETQLINESSSFSEEMREEAYRDWLRFETRHMRGRTFNIADFANGDPCAAKRRELGLPPLVNGKVQREPHA